MTRTRILAASFALTALALVGMASAREARAAYTCDPVATQAAMAEVDATCPCEGRPDGFGGTTPWGKHRHYKKCIRVKIRELVRASGGTLKRRCLRETIRCTNKSTCGTEGALTCTVPSTGVCTGGFCSNRPEEACLVDDDCTSIGCHIAPAAAACPNEGVLGTGSCCDPEPYPPIE